MTLKDFRIRGLCAAPFTPFVDGSGSSSTPADHVNRVDHKSIALHVEELLRQGVKYAFVCGTTGEGVTLSVTERQATLETWIKASRGRLSIIAHVGAESIADMLALAHHASGSGAVAIAAHTTTFNKPPTLDSTVELLALLSAAAPSLPLYFYYIAIKTGAALRCDKLLEAIHADPARVPTFRGVKFTDFDAHIYANCVAFADGAYDILSGRDEILLAALVMGGKGAVGSTYNYMGRVYNDLIAAFEKGDLVTALSLQRKSQKLVDILNAGDKYGAGVNIGKAVMELRLGGKGCGHPRYPGVPMALAAQRVLKEDLTAIGFFEW